MAGSLLSSSCLRLLTTLSARNGKLPGGDLDSLSLHPPLRATLLQVRVSRTVRLVLHFQPTSVLPHHLRRWLRRSGSGLRRSWASLSAARAREGGHAEEAAAAGLTLGWWALIRLLVWTGVAKRERLPPRRRWQSKQSVPQAQASAESAAAAAAVLFPAALPPRVPALTRPPQLRHCSRARSRGGGAGGQRRHRRGFLRVPLHQHQLTTTACPEAL